MTSLTHPAIPLLVVLMTLVGNAAASRTTMATGYSIAGPQDSAAAYRSAVEAALASPQPGYGTTRLGTFEMVNNHDRFGSESDLAYHFTVEFEVPAALAGQWHFRAGVDFGDGGTMMLDDTVLDYRRDDLWWVGYWDSTGVLSGSVALAEGRHTLHLYGLERCCDGFFTTQFRVGNSGYTTFSDDDSLLPVPEVPEPSKLALLASGSALLAVARRRRRPAS
ncbi:CCXG family PEP-CTERM protein [Massilia sp. YMA4]|uniref:CCXG family PEP-CTERM protein n=1 Tax=Massilia sp. YMA4 TaxID=1593482 RepID=UPI000DD12016|nr:CCXG family PEP-CTERM protein [Massilia sp. YMA4]AXA93438.1 PEP-CTERM sorting domain-containing protein [Massilia sp. YMA4]